MLPHPFFLCNRLCNRHTILLLSVSLVENVLDTRTFWTILWGMSFLERRSIERLEKTNLGKRPAVMYLYAKATAVIIVCRQDWRGGEAGGGGRGGFSLVTRESCLRSGKKKKKSTTQATTIVQEASSKKQNFKRNYSYERINFI